MFLYFEAVTIYKYLCHNPINYKIKCPILYLAISQYTINQSLQAYNYKDISINTYVNK